MMLEGLCFPVMSNHIRKSAWDADTVWAIVRYLSLFSEYKHILYDQCEYSQQMRG